MQSIRIGTDPAFRYLLRLGDTCLILGQRIGEWCGHAPILEEDIALSNMALDLIAPEGDGTRYTATARHWDEDTARRHAEMGFEQGWGVCADQLKALCESG